MIAQQYVLLLSFVDVLVPSFQIGSCSVSFGLHCQCMILLSMKSNTLVSRSSSYDHPRGYELLPRSSFQTVCVSVSIVGHSARACAFIDIGEPIRYTLDQVAEYKKGGEERKKVLFQRSC